MRRGEGGDGGEGRGEEKGRREEREEKTRLEFLDIVWFIRLEVKWELVSFLADLCVFMIILK